MPLFRGTFFLKSAELSVSVFEIFTELWVPFEETCRIYVPFWENVVKLLGGRFSINKMKVQLEIKV